MHAAENDDIGIGFSGLLTQLQWIAGKIGDILNFGPLIIMDENDGVPLFLQSSDFINDFCIFCEHKRLDSD